MLSAGYLLLDVGCIFGTLQCLKEVKLAPPNILNLLLLLILKILFF